MVQERAAKRRACAEEVLSTGQALAEWFCVKHLELRDALETRDRPVVAELSHFLAAGAVKMETLSGAVSMVASSVRSIPERKIQEYGLLQGLAKRVIRVFLQHTPSRVFLIPPRRFGLECAGFSASFT